MLYRSISLCSVIDIPDVFCYFCISDIPFPLVDLVLKARWRLRRCFISIR